MMNNSVELKVSLITEESVLHDYLFKTLNFPSYYGSNWDAFDECINNDVSRPINIKVIGFMQLLKQVPRGAKLLKDCLTNYGERYPDSVHVEIS